MHVKDEQDNKVSDENNVDTTGEIYPESDDEQMNIAPKPHKARPRRSNRLAGRHPQYSGLICDEHILLQDIWFLSSINMQDGDFNPSHATNYLIRSAYVSEDNMVENIHPYALSAKVQTHKSDNPTYKDILRLPEEERLVWEEAMVKELQSLRKIESFKMVARPQVAKTLESTWVFKKKRYPDGGLKKIQS